MIHFSLQCGRGHAFDGWFTSSEAFETQRQDGDLGCPICGTPDVARALMAPAVRTRAATTPATDEAPKKVPAETEPAEATATHAALPEGDRKAFLDAMRALRKAVVDNGTDVGTSFPEEARRIHYGEAEPRQIYGQAETDEARALIEEGIKVLPLPILPEDRN